jgi:putative transcriptional regulator
MIHSPHRADDDATNNAQQSTLLAPGLLIAVPGLHDPMFAHTVVLLVESGPWGAYGMVINRRAPIELGALLDSAGIPHQNATQQTVWLGGPVQPQSGLVLYHPEPGLADYEPHAEVMPGVRMSSSMELLRDIALGRGPKQYALVLGRTSWAAGQLEAELSAGVWLPCEPDPALLFVPDGEVCWREALATMGADPAHVSATAMA